jgi:hypothetical protein
MNGTTSKANVYYLPAAEPVEIPQPPSPWSRFRNRLVGGWWRARLSLADLRIGGGGRREDDDYAALLRNVVEESPAELIDRRRMRPSRPAKVLDFEAARLRLRPRPA